MRKCCNACWLISLHWSWWHIHCATTVTAKPAMEPSELMQAAEAVDMELTHAGTLPRPSVPNAAAALGATASPRACLRALHDPAAVKPPASRGPLLFVLM
jgi:hypothetical protein